MTDDSNSEFGSVEYDPTVRTYYTHYAGDVATPSTVVARAMADITDRRIEDLRPLQEVIDSDALDDLLARRDESDDSTSVEVTFAYSGYEVTVSSSGVVEIHPEAEARHVAEAEEREE